MQIQIDNLGKVAVTVEKDFWDVTKDYDRLTIVETPNNTYATYISRKPVPAGTVLTDRNYWIPFSSLKEEIVIDFNAFVASLTEAMQETKDYADDTIEKGIEDITAIKEEAMSIITYIADNGIDSSVLAPDSVTSEKIKAGNVLSEHISAGEVKSANIGAGEVKSGNIGEGEVKSANIGEGEVKSINIGGGEVKEEHIAAGAITTEKLATPVIEQLQTIMDDTPTAGSVLPVQSGGTLKILEWIYKDEYLSNVLKQYISISTNVLARTSLTYGTIGTDGSISSSTSYRYTNMFPVKPSTNYIGSGASNFRVALYDINGTFTRRVSASTGFTTAVNEVYARVNSDTSATGWRTLIQLNEGDTVLEYEPFYIIVDRSVLDIDFLIEQDADLAYSIYRGSAAAYTSGYVSYKGNEQSGTASRRSPFLPYNGGDIIAYGKSTGDVPLAIFFSTNASGEENVTGFWPDPRSESYNDKFVVIKESDVPANTAYVRFNGNASSIYYNSLGVGIFTDESKVSSMIAVETTRATSEENAINRELSTKLIQKSTNLADKSSLIYGKKLDYQTGETVSSDGAKRSVTTEFIPVKSSTQYRCNAIFNVCEYATDSDDSFVTGHNFSSGSSNRTFTTSSTTHYIKYTVAATKAAAVPQINEGSTLLPYEPYYDWMVPDDGAYKMYEAVYGAGRYYHGPYDIRKSDFQSWYEGQQEAYTVFGTGGNPEATPPTGAFATTYADVIDAYDALMAEDTSYITKNALGTASGTDAEENEYTMYEYVFKPKRNSGGDLNKRVVPKILIDSGVHGFEKNSVFGLYYFLKDIVENWDKNESLKALRCHVEIHVIPVVNPYGFDRCLYKNANHVNINRNWECGNWQTDIDPSSKDYNGVEPFDQPETAIVRDWIMDNAEHLLMYINCHTDEMWNADGYNNACHWMLSSDRDDDYFNRLYNVGARHIEDETLMWTKMYPSVNPSGLIGEINKENTENTSKGTAKQWACTYANFLSMTFEGFNGLKVDNTAVFGILTENCQKAYSENIGNAVIQICYEYANS